MFCNTIGLSTELLTDEEEGFADLDQFVSLRRRTAAYRPQSNSRLRLKHRRIENLC